GAPHRAGVATVTVVAGTPERAAAGALTSGAPVRRRAVVAGPGAEVTDPAVLGAEVTDPVVLGAEVTDPVVLGAEVTDPVVLVRGRADPAVARAAPTGTPAAPTAASAVAGAGWPRRRRACPSRGSVRASRARSSTAGCTSSCGR
ncbi:MAG TPA: hypothetical protein VH915_00645, partial [Pedococcus sp.]